MRQHRRSGRRARLALGLAAALVAGATLPAAASNGTGGPSEAGKGTAHAPGLQKQDTLRWVAPKDFRIGSAAAGGGHHANREENSDPFHDDETYRRLLASEFNSITPENWLKWEEVHPARDEYDFARVDDVVAFAEEHGQDVRGHALVWHNQNPAWLTEGDFTEQELRDILRDHIHTVVGRYAGRIQQWDVVNEVIDDSGQLRDTFWLRELGPSYIADAFRWAHEADPDALLFVNDYNVEGLNAKSDAYYELVTDLLAEGAPVHGFGAQGHLDIQYPFPWKVEENLRRFDDLGLATAITEVDVRMDLPATEEKLERQADDFRRLLEACLNVAGCQSFTVWGFNDEHSWVQGFFSGQGSPSIMDGDYSRKPSYFALQSTLAEARWGDAARYAKHPAHGG
jgi:endo-1,4-beta-xylanase